MLNNFCVEFLKVSEYYQIYYRPTPWRHEEESKYDKQNTTKVKQPTLSLLQRDDCKISSKRHKILQSNTLILLAKYSP